jgi:hypothetical protein
MGRNGFDSRWQTSEVTIEPNQSRSPEFRAGGPPTCRLCGRFIAAADSRAWLRIVPLHRCLSNGGGQSRVPAWHDGCQSVKPIPFKGFCTSAYPVTSKSGFLQKANFV